MVSGSFNFNKIRTRFGIPFLGIILVLVTIFLLQFFMDRLLVREANSIGMRAAAGVAGNLKNLGDVFAGKINGQTKLYILQRLSTTGQIFGYEFKNPKGFITLKTGSYHSPSVNTPAQYHSHIHNTASADATASPVDFNSVSSGSLHQHTISLKFGDGKIEPEFYAYVNHPVYRDGTFQGSIGVYVDQTKLHTIFNDTIFWLSITLLGVSALGFGIPSMFYIRGKREIEVAAKQVEFLAQHDEMTQLVNRKRFVETVDTLLDNHQDGSSAYALHVIDVDRLKIINDTYGLDVGDELLRKISDRLRGVFSSEHIVSRLGGDEFAVLQTDAVSEEAVKEFATRLLSIFSGPYSTNGENVETSASIGVARSQKNASSCLSLMMCAEIALTIVKNTSRAGYLIFEPGMKRRLDKRTNLEEAIRHAHTVGLFEVFYQPLFKTFDTQLCGFEALIRLKDKTGDYISPVDFIPVAEEIGLINEIGLWVLKTATKSAASWPDHLFVAVNLSTKQFENGELPEAVEDALKESGLAASRLELEITEGLIMQNTEWNLTQLHAIKNLGVSIAMDDFGTGYSSLSYLWRFPFDKIKIDQVFLREAEDKNKNVSKIIQTIIAMGHSLNMKVTVEGVETVGQLEMLQRFNCDYLQGFYLGRPQPEDHIAPLLMSHLVQDIKTTRQSSGKQQKAQSFIVPSVTSF